MEFLIERMELQILCLLCRTKTFDLQTEGCLTPPMKWCGETKAVFCLRTACNEMAKYNGLEPPSDDTIKEHWSNILRMRHEDQVRKSQAKKSS